MKTVLVLVLTVVAFVAIPVLGDSKKLADKDFLQKQLDYIKLFHRLQQHNLFQDQIDIGDHYDIEANIAHYKYPHVVKNFISYYKKGMLPRGEPFSVYYEKHIEQAIKLFELLFAANDYDTFYKTACWARDRVNEGMFMYALTVAAFHREDTKDFVLPSPYEVNPYLFVEDDVIQQAYKYWTKESGTDKHVEHVIPVNFTARSQEDLVAYFREDVDLNAFNMYFRYIYPTWFNTTLYGKTFDRRGEQFYYTYHQIYARYFLERLSNSLPDVKPFQYSKPLKTGYNPHLRYQNGEEMPARPSNMYPTNIDLFYVSDIKNYESRVEKAIDFGYAFDEHRTPYSLYHDQHGMDYLGQMIEGTSNSPYQYFYGSIFHFYRLLVGHVVDPYHKNGLAPSALEHHQTALRDPAFYQLWKRIDHIVQKYKNRLPRYTYDELSFPGVKIENVDVGKLYTYFEHFEHSLGNAMYLGKLEDVLKANIRARHYRLNHKPFTYNIEVSSDKAQDVYVRIFLGPKYDSLGHECELDERRHYFVEMDRFVHKVEAGKTVIERKSHDSSIISDSHDSYRNLFKKVSDALEGKDQYYIDNSHKYCGYPENLLLPKGKKGGQTFTFYVIVTPYVKQDEHDLESYHYKAFSYCGVGHGRKYPDDKPLGFPFDRKIHDYDFYTPNMYFKDVVIFHKKYDEVHNETN
ncbi:allergen Cr-PI-like [Periplaneta americana]|uniref:allergen Cr-PI-like n=1 Tax=Periplaneta americana TaxID=6978 RepID=UPI0037E8C4D1